MRTKKHPDKDVDRKGFLFRQMGLALTLLLIIAAFNWESSELDKFDWETNVHFEDEEVLPEVTSHAGSPRPSPPEPPVYREAEDEAKDERKEEEQEQEEHKGDDLLSMNIPEPPPENIDNGSPVSMAALEKQPSFPGGVSSMQQYLREHIKYPRSEREAGNQGVVIVNFIVEQDGSLSQIHVPDDMGVSDRLNAEAIRVVSSMPDWEPGKQNGRPVRVRVNLPVRFTLR